LQTTNNERRSGTKKKSGKRRDVFEGEALEPPQLLTKNKTRKKNRRQLLTGGPRKDVNKEDKS